MREGRLERPTEQVDPEILRTNLGTLVNLFKGRVQGGEFVSESDRLRASHILAIAESMMEGEGEQQRIKDPYELMLRMRVARELALEGALESGKDQIRAMYGRIDMPEMHFPEEWVDVRLQGERIPEFRKILEQEKAAYVAERGGASGSIVEFKEPFLYGRKIEFPEEGPGTEKSG